MVSAMTVVDSHHHFWDLGMRSYDWMPEGSPLRVNYLPDDLRPRLSEAGVDATVIVQAHPSVEETKWLLDIAAETNFVAGVVGWVDLLDPNVGDTLDELQQSPYFKGIRHLWEIEEDPAWLAKSQAIAGLKEVERRGLCYDFLVRPPNLPHVPRIMEQVPDLRAVIDHIAKPNIKDREVEPWLSLMREVASIDGMRCKVSGMTTEADMENWTQADMTPYVQHVLGMFGADRLMFGSDWPVSTQGTTYDRWADTIRDILVNLPDEPTRYVFGQTAIRFYDLGDTLPQFR